MATHELIMPKMGESIMEATILKWLKKEGDHIEADESVLEIATDKVDSEVPSTYTGTITKLLYKEGDVVPVGKAIAIIQAGSETGGDKPSPVIQPTTTISAPSKQASADNIPSSSGSALSQKPNSTEHRFYSPLVRNIAKSEGISQGELDAITGTGTGGRVTKHDMANYLQNRSSKPSLPSTNTSISSPSVTPTAVSYQAPAVSVSGAVEIVEMDRMRRLIADHMVMSKHVSPHVTSFVEADVTNIVLWREKIKNQFQKREGEKITFTPIFIEAIVNALKDFPGVNASVDGNKIIIKKYINIGVATALPSGNLIVPVVKGAEKLNLVGITKEVNRIVDLARTNKLAPNDIQDGSFTVTNVGTFGNLSGTPIINQPQVAILSTGAIKKKPAVLETEYGDVIAIRQLMYLSLSYDHRVVDGFLGGSFLRRVADNLENFDVNRAY